MCPIHTFDMEQQLNSFLQEHFTKDLASASEQEIYVALLHYVKDQAQARPLIQGERKLYYISAEFLIGKLLSNNLINLGIFNDVKETLARHGKDLSKVEEVELEPSLGNGGLGRLAACFLDSIATLGLCGDGIGLNYHFGLFKQVFRNHKQTEEKNDWLTDASWLNEQPAYAFTVPFKDFSVQSKLYDLDVLGYNQGRNKLHLFDLASVDESIVKDGIGFDQADIVKNLTLFLYPDDSTHQGHMLRIYQQYFMVSNAAQYIIAKEKEAGHDLHDLHKHVVVQINDTHPTMVIPELIYRLQQEGIALDKAVQIVRNTCAYTNHTILAEALEKWPYQDLAQVIPHLMPIIDYLEQEVMRVTNNHKLRIIDDQGRVHMAHLDIHFGFSVNGVAALHTDILKENELHDFFQLYPEKFNNKTNGVTFRRWLLHANQELVSFITSLIGDKYQTDANELGKLNQFLDNPEVLAQLAQIKQTKKEQLAQYLATTQGIKLNTNSIFDIQVKRLHEYKRQQMNLLFVINYMKMIKSGFKPAKPLTVIFGAKAAPAYVLAKDIIHAILTLSELIANDPEVSPYLQVVMVENYNVTNAEKLIPACDISEQISLASKEASGTGNMKFMLNGAVTLGTDDGANVEIHELVGGDNIFIFGATSSEVIAHYENHSYHAHTLYDTDARIREVVDFLISPAMLAIGDAENLRRLHHELINKDWFMTLLDFKSYCATKLQALEVYTTNPQAWNRMSLRNIAQAGFFSSDRTIGDYNRDIWKLAE